MARRIRTKLHKKQQTKKQARIRLTCSLLCLFSLGFLFYAFPVISAAFPTKAAAVSDIGPLAEKKDVFLSMTLKDLKYTGYAQMRDGQAAGYFYYLTDQTACQIVLLSPDSCGQGETRVAQAEFYGSIQAADDAYNRLLDALSNDLSWTKSGIRSKLTPYYLSEPGCRHGRSVILFAFLALSALYAVCSAVCSAIRLRLPSDKKVGRPTSTPLTPHEGHGHFARRAQLQSNILPLVISVKRSFL